VFVQVFLDPFYPSKIKVTIMQNKNSTEKCAVLAALLLAGDGKCAEVGNVIGIGTESFNMASTSKVGDRDSAAVD